MKLVKPSPHVWIWVGAGIFLLFIFITQFFLTFRQKYPEAVSDETVERSRAFVEQTQQILEERQSQPTP